MACLWPAAASAQDREPDWLKRPTAESLSSVYPTAARRKGLDGRASISCIVTIQGALRDCKVLSEDPVGYGFGGAAIALSPQLLMKPALKAGRPVEGTVRIPITWSGMRGLPAFAPAKGDVVYTHLPWTQAPTFEEVLAAYPAKARARKVGGAVVLDCMIEKTGGLSHCRTIREAPAGYGFVSAAKLLTGRFLTPTTGNDGKSIAGSRVHLGLTFAASALDGETVIGRPKWVMVPAINDLAAVLPEAARKAKVFKARVSLSCRVVVGGKVDGCRVIGEEPGSLGYDGAALKLVPYFGLAVWTDEGLPTVGGTVSIPLRFDLEQAMASAP